MNKEEGTPKKAKTVRKRNIEPMMVSEAAETRTRRNKSATIERTDRFSNISDGLVPFNYSKSTANYSGMDVKDAVILCQKAYYNFAIFRTTIDLMTEFTVSDIFLTGGNKKSRNFFNAYFDKINLWGLQDKFFREYYRSGNVFVYRFDSKIQKKDIRRIAQTFGAEDKDMLLPSRYIILNPADVQAKGNITFQENKYYKVLSDYELERLRNPKTEEDLEVFKNLPPDIKKQVKSRRTPYLTMPLDAEKMYAVFYKKQDYEPLAVPMGFPVLEDLNWKQEMKKMDMAMTRTTNQAILLVTMGDEPEKGGVNQKNIEAMQKLFTNQSVGRVLIADYTTKAEFVIPDIAQLLDPKKYETVNKDIQIGLNNILLGAGERFANQTAKAEMFLGRLKQARESFLNDFLIPEIKRISKEIGLQSSPVPKFDEITLRDPTNMARIYSRMVEIGILTPEEGMEALQSGRLPDVDQSVENHEEFLKLKKKGLYEPMIGGSPGGHPANPNPGQNGQPAKNGKVNKIPEQKGRPAGTGVPQKTKNVSPVGEGPQSRVSSPPVAASDKFSMKKVQENILLSQKLNTKIVSSLKRKHKLKELTEKQLEVVDTITNIVISNEDPDNWIKSSKGYVDKPIDQNKDRVNKVQEVALEHQLDDFMAGILYASRT